MKAYDFIFAGGGVSGLSLAYHLARSPLGNSSILIIDREFQPKDHTLSFWSDRPSPFDPVISNSWNQLQIQSENYHQTFNLEDYRYYTLHLRDFTAFIRQELSIHPQIEFLQGTINTIEDSSDCARVMINGSAISGKWIFDSRFQPSEFSPDPTRYISLHQHFKGWEIETEEPVFNPRMATLFDFRIPQKAELRFFYLLPFSPNHALVEYVLLSPENDDEAIRFYIEDVLGIRHYRVLSKEGGVTLLSDGPFRRQVSRHVLYLGLCGGRAKPSSGYAFNRIQQDSTAIVRSLLKTGHPFDIPPDQRFYRFCDSTLLQIMKQHGETIKPIYTAMFKKNPVGRVFHFLDESASVGENLALMVSLPLGYFWEALLRTTCSNLGFYRRIS